MTSAAASQGSLPTRVQLVGALLGLAGIFLPFAAGTSPWTALRDSDFTPLAAAALLSPLITALAIRRATRGGSLTSWERGLSWLVAAGFLVVYGRGWYLALANRSSAGEAPVASFFATNLATRIAILLPILLLVAGCWVTVRAARRSPRMSDTPILALRTMYVVYASGALTAFFGNWDVGAWMILGATLIHLYLLGLAWRGG